MDRKVPSPLLALPFWAGGPGWDKSGLSKPWGAISQLNSSMTSASVPTLTSLSDRLLPGSVRQNKPFPPEALPQKQKESKTVYVICHV